MLISFVPQPHVAHSMKVIWRNLFFTLFFSLAIPLFLTGSAHAAIKTKDKKIDFVAVAYTSPDFQGEAWRIPGPGLYDLRNGFGLPNDSICAISVAPGYKLTIYEHAEFQGESEEFGVNSQGSSDLGKRNRWASSLKVEKAGKTDEGTLFEWFVVQVENMGLPNKIEVDPTTTKAAKALAVHADAINTFQQSFEPHWYGTTTDAQRIALADDLLKIFSDCGVDVATWEPNNFAQTMNNFFDWRKDLSVWEVACLVLNVDTKPFEQEKKPSQQ